MRKWYVTIAAVGAFCGGAASVLFLFCAVGSSGSERVLWGGLSLFNVFMGVGNVYFAVNEIANA